MRRSPNGFSPIEIIVVIACIALLAGILAPLVFKNIEDARIAKARSDIKSIQAALTQFYSDVGCWPARSDAGVEDQLYVLYSTEDGSTSVVPPGAYMPGNPDQADALADHLIDNNQSYPAWNGKSGWNGPYWGSDGLDPWGNSYLVYVLGFWFSSIDPGTDFTEAWILSAGPDGIMQTFASDEVIATDSDDIGVRLK